MQTSDDTSATQGQSAKSSPIHTAIVAATDRVNAAGAHTVTCKIEIDSERTYAYVGAWGRGLSHLASGAAHYHNGVADEQTIVGLIHAAADQAIADHREKEQIERVRQAIRAENKIAAQTGGAA